MPIVPAGSINFSTVGVPGVIVQVLPPNPLLNGVPTNIIGGVGTASWGPVNSPTVVGTLQEGINYFGLPVARTYDLMTAVYAAMQQGANSFVLVRVTDGTDTAATANLADTNSVNGAVLTSIHTGSYPNSTSGNCQVNVSNSAIVGSYKVTISFANGVPEVFDNISGSGPVFWSNLVNAINLGQNQLRGPSQLCTALTTNVISSISVTSPGSYATMPSVGIVGPGSGAVLAPSMKAVSDSVVAAGSGYAPADTITLTGGTHSSAAILTVVNTTLASLAINAVGSGYAVDDTITLSGGTASIPAVIKVTSVSTGTITGVSIVSGGSYTANAASFTQASTSGSGTGATFNTTEFGVLTASVTTPGSYTVLPSNPVAQGSTSGTGSGATFTVLWGLLSVAVSGTMTGYNSSDVFTVTGGGGTGGASGTIVLSGATSPALGTVSFSGGTDGAINISSAIMLGSDTATPRTGMYALRNTNASIAMLIDLYDPTSYQAQNTFANQEALYMVSVEAPSNQDNIANMVSILQGASVQSPTSYNFKLMGGDWVYFNDPFNSITRLISPQGYVAGILAVTPPSGSSLNKQMTAIVATQKSFEQRVYSDADLQTLITAGVDIVTKPIPLSPSVFGVRLGCNTSTSVVTKFDNYPRMVNFIGRTILSGMGSFIGLPQTPDVQRQARDTISTFLSNLQQLGLIGTLDGSPAFSVILDSSNNPPNQVVLGFMQADVQVVLFSIVQQLVVSLQAGGNVSIQVLPPQVTQGQ